MIVQEIGKSQGGKTKVKAGGQWYFLAGDKDTGQHIACPAVGQDIEIKAGSFKMGNATFLTMDAWRPVAAQMQAPTSKPAQQSSSPAGYIEEATLRYISNVVGQAVAAGTIKTPGQIFSWFNAAKLAAEGKQAAVPFSDDLPSREPGSDDSYNDRSKW